MLRTLASKRRLYAILAIAAFVFARGAVAAHACAVSMVPPISDAPTHMMQQTADAAPAHHACEQVEQPDAVDSSAVCHAHCLHDVQGGDPAKLSIAADLPILAIVVPEAIPTPVSRVVRERFLLAGRAEPPPLVRHGRLLI